MWGIGLETFLSQLNKISKISSENGSNHIHFTSSSTETIFVWNLPFPTTHILHINLTRMYYISIDAQPLIYLVTVSTH